MVPKFPTSSTGTQVMWQGSRDLNTWCWEDHIIETCWMIHGWFAERNLLVSTLFHLKLPGQSSTWQAHVRSILCWGIPLISAEVKSWWSSWYSNDITHIWHICSDSAQGFGDPSCDQPQIRNRHAINDLQDFEALKDPAKGQTFPSDFSPHHEAIARTVATATASVAMAVNGQAIATRLGLCVFFP